MFFYAVGYLNNASIVCSLDHYSSVTSTKSRAQSKINFFLLRFFYNFCCQFGENHIILENHSLYPVFTCTCGHWSGGLICGEASRLPNEGGFTWAVKGFSYSLSGNQCLDWLYCLHVCFGESRFLSYSILLFFLGPHT